MGLESVRYSIDFSQEVNILLWLIPSDENAQVCVLQTITDRHVSKYARSSAASANTKAATRANPNQPTVSYPLTLREITLLRVFSVQVPSTLV